MEYFEIINRYLQFDSQVYRKYIFHCTAVTKKSVQIAKTLKLSKKEITFIEEAAMLHDIGICSVDMGNNKIGIPYICHGIVGEQILAKEGLIKHSLVARNHIGVGLTAKQIKKKRFPLPVIDMKPQTIHQEIITYSDLFFSKGNLFLTRTSSQVRNKIGKYGTDVLKTFEDWHKKFKVNGEGL